MKQLLSTLLFILIAYHSAGADQLKSNHLQNFDLVWQTVNQEHFDPNFGGIDWEGIYRSYRPKITQAKNIQDFKRITNGMLFELKLSHLMLFSEKDLKNYIPTLFAEGTIGVELRLSQKRAMVTKIISGLPGDAAGLKAGYILSHINGRSVADILAKIKWPPPFNQRNRENIASNYLMGLLDGPPGSEVELTCLDRRNRQRKMKIRRQAREPGQIISTAMPPIHIEFESRILDDNIAYVWFNHFAPPVDKLFIQTLTIIQQTKGLIIDLRGNPGGYFSIVNKIAAQLIPTETNLYSLKFRDKTVSQMVKPASRVYRQPVTVLIDTTSLSSSELFSACLQALGRVTIVGERSPGYLVGAKWIRLTNGLSFMHTNLLPLPLDGRIIEGVGIVPEIEVIRDRNELLEGIDSQLEAARQYLLQTGN